ncbi:ASCH domain-containing protein [Eggerthellaceae bacterium zg-1084]|uniref:ASCH domain-containing protein n=1 Tax=Berryella wangjianweii TaxID=2734634 RepID=UPI0015550936|nr:ASCH domain-containing protein [Berryella wangjianweii]NPD30501.1 ASCH domain-containing protein [Berryella wangjianweii]
MKAISVLPIWGTFFLFGAKSIECRTWQTSHRGDLLICTSSRREPGGISGHAVCVAKLADIVPFRKKHLELACMDEMPAKPSYAWILEDVRLIRPFPVKGKLRIYEVDEPVEVMSEPVANLSRRAEKEALDVINELYFPLVHFGDDPDARELWS